MTEQQNQTPQEPAVPDTPVIGDLESRGYREDERYQGEYDVRPGVTIPKEKYLNALAKIPPMVLMAESQRIEKLTILRENAPEAACHWQHQATFDEVKYRSENGLLFGSDEEEVDPSDSGFKMAPVQSATNALDAIMPGAKKEKGDE